MLQRPALRALAAAFLVLVIASLVFMLRQQGSDEVPEPVLGFTPLSFSDLEGWREHDPAPALAPFRASCEKLMARDDAAPANPMEALGTGPFDRSLSGNVGDWRPACESAITLAGAELTPAAARAFFDLHFVPVSVYVTQARRAWHGGLRYKTENKGLLTGYYEPSLKGSRTQTEVFSAPILSRPDDLVMTDLGAFRPDLAGVRIAGRVRDGRLFPYEDRTAIEDGALADKAAPLAWAAPVDAFFLQIQGSGRVVLEDGDVVRVGYAGQNGHPYTAIGRTLIDEGHLSREEVSMQSIRAWLAAAGPDDATRVMHTNASYVFFRELTELDDPALGPLGAQGVPLTPMRSLAADRRFYAMGAPVWVTAENLWGEDAEPEPFAQLMIAQDTGGAIRGAVRGDLFWGWDEASGEKAGALKAPVEMVLFMPKPLAARQFERSE